MIERRQSCKTASMPLLGVCAHAVRTCRTTADGTWRPKLLPQTPWFLKTLKENGIDEQMEGAGSKIRSSVELPCDCIINVGRDNNAKSSEA